MENKLEQHLVLGPLRHLLTSPQLWCLAKALISGYGCHKLSSNFGIVTLLPSQEAPPRGAISLKILGPSFGC